MARITEIFEDEDTPMPDAPPLSEYEGLSLDPLSLSEEDPRQPAQQSAHQDGSTSLQTVSHENERGSYFRTPPPRARVARRVPNTWSAVTAPIPYSQAIAPYRARRSALYPVVSSDDLSELEHRRPEYTLEHAISIAMAGKAQATVETYRTRHNGDEVEFERTVLTQKHATKRKLTETFDYDSKRRRYQK